MPKRIHVAVAVVRRGDEVLIARRPDHKHQGGLLEFPGGKVEKGETGPCALVRELAEEVAIVADPVQMEPLIQISHDYPDKSVLLDVWQVQEYTGVPEGLEGQPVAWFKIGDLQEQDFPAANRAIISALRLPSEWLITGECKDAESLARRLSDVLPRGGASGLLLRQPALSRPAYLDLAKAALAFCQAHHMPLMLHGDATLLQRMPEAAGIHLSQHALAQSERGTLAPGKWLGVSCHSPAELRQAAEVGADYAFLSPVCSTVSHPDRPALGWQAFADWVEKATLPVYALGGMTTDDNERSRRLGAQGIAGISHWWT